MNVPKIRLKLNELGIDSSHYKDLRKALKELLDFSVRIKIDGKVVIQHVFLQHYGGCGHQWIYQGRRGIRPF